MLASNNSTYTVSAHSSGENSTSTAIGQQINYSTTRLPPLILKEVGSWNLSQVSDYFIPREKILSQIRKKFSTFNDQKVILSVLKGMGGAGKTTLANYVAKEQVNYLFRARFNAESRQTLETEYLNFGIFCNLFEKKDNLPIPVIIGKVKRYLESNPDWLLIYDNANTYDEIKDLFPQKGGHILVTSRRDDWPDSSIIAVEEMSQAEARSLFRKITNRQESNSLIDKLVEAKLSKIPLAIAQASAFIRKSGISIENYLNEYEKQTLILLAKKDMPSGDQHDPITITLKIAMDRIQADCPEATVLFQACSFMDSTDIPQTLLQEYLEKNKEIGNIAYYDALIALKSYSLLIDQPEQKTLSVHPLVQTIIRLSQPEAEQYEWLMRLIKECLEKLQGEEYQIVLEQAVLFRHFDKLLKHRIAINLPPEESLFKAFNRAGALHNTIMTQNSLQQALDYYQQALTRASENSMQYAFSLSGIASAYIKLGGRKNLQRALKKYEKALTIQRASLGLQHPNIASTLNNIGTVYHDLGGQENLQRALEKYEEALTIQQTSLDPQDISIATTLNNIGTVYHDLGGRENLQHALKKYEEALTITRASLDPQHPAIATALHNIGKIYSDLGGQANLQCALKKYEEAITIMRTSLGPQHPDIATTLNKIGNVYSDLGGQENLQCALKKYEEALIIRRASLHPQHPAIAETLHNIGKIYSDLGGQANLQCALKKYEEALTIEQASLDPQHPDIATTLNNIGNVYSRLSGQENLQRALKKYEEALIIRRASLHPQHPAIAETLHNIGEVYKNLGGQANLQCALKKYEEALSIMRASLSPQHLNIATTLNSIGKVYKDLGGQANLQRAFEKFEEALPIMRVSLGSQHLDIAFASYSLGLMYIVTQQNSNQTFFLLNEALNIFKHELAPTHHEIVEVAQTFPELKELLISNISPEAVLVLKKISEFEMWLKTPEISTKNKENTIQRRSSSNSKDKENIKVVTTNSDPILTISGGKSIGLPNIFKGMFLQNPQNELAILVKKYRLEDTSPILLEKGLRQAAANNQNDDLKKFIKYTKNLDAQDNNPKSLKTALHWAVLKKAKDCIISLLGAGAEIHIKDAIEKTPMDYAIDMGDTEIIQLLHHQHSNKKSQAVLKQNEFTIKGYTASTATQNQIPSIPTNLSQEKNMAYSTNREQNLSRTTALTPPPKPYDYALLSQAIYSDDLSEEGSGKPVSAAQQACYTKGWRLLKFVEEPNGYIGGIFVREADKQIVIAHRGSKNADSWITDIETVIQVKPGGFLASAIALMNDPILTQYKNQGYRLSHTGHSLGGFLAQVCVFWAHRREFPTYDPDVSAVTFDSPGSADFMKVIQSNLASEKKSIDIETLNIHNYCAMPTIVSTFGTQTGTIWHLQGEGHDVRFAVVMNHPIQHMIERFDTETGYPKNCRQMTDWPQADYSAYLEHPASHLAGQALMAPFRFLNQLYIIMKDRYGFATDNPTWFDRVIASNAGQVNSFLASTSREQGHWPEAETLEAQLSLAINSHYSNLSEENSMLQMGLFHFDESVQEFIKELHFAKKKTTDFGWNAFLREQFEEEGAALLEKFGLRQIGERYDVVLKDSTGNVLEFHDKLQNLLQRKGIVSFYQFVSGTIKSLNEQVNELKNEQPKSKHAQRMIDEEIHKLNEQIEQLQKVQQDAKKIEIEVHGLVTGENAKGETIGKDIIHEDVFQGRPSDINALNINYSSDDKRPILVTSNVAGKAAKGLTIGERKTIRRAYELSGTSQSAPVDQNALPFREQLFPLEDNSSGSDAPSRPALGK